MTCHPRFDAGGNGTAPERSAAHELRWAHAGLELQFPDESFSPACIGADPTVTVGLLAFFIALKGVLAAQVVL